MARTSQAFVNTTEFGGAAATTDPILAANPSREFLQVANPGGSPVKFRFGAAPDANNGFTLAAGQTVTYDVRVPTGALYVTAGATLYGITG